MGGANTVDSILKKEATILVVFSLLVLLANAIEGASPVLSLLCLALSLLFVSEEKKKTGSVISVQSVFIGIWLLTVGLSLLKLHPAQMAWALETQVCVIATPSAFWLGNLVVIHFPIGALQRNSRKDESRICRKWELPADRVSCLFGLAILFAFGLDIWKSGGLPVLSNDPAAYMNFGMKYVHYITVMGGIYPSVVFLVHKRGGFEDSDKLVKVFVALCLCVTLVLPILIVSRQLMVLELFVFSVTYLIEERKESRVKVWHLLAAALVGFIAWCIMSLFRNQGPEYLASVFMLPPSHSKVEMAAWQIYLYSSFNYDNFDAAIRNLTESTAGAYSLLPAYVLTGAGAYAKDLITSLVLDRALPTFNTYSIMLPPFCDAGILGLIVYMFVLGFVCRAIERRTRANRGLTTIVAYSLVLYSLAIAFFTNEFALPVFWVYLICLFGLTVIMNVKTLREPLLKEREGLK